MNREILPLLVGNEFWGWGRAADLASFQIGCKRTVTDHLGHPKIVGQYALHIQCPWRITQDDKLIVASGDLYYPCDNSTPQLDFNWEPQGANKRDIELEGLLNSGKPLFVQEVKLECAALLKIVLTEGLCLEVFPDTSVREENWRLFQPYTDGPHIVAKGGSIVKE